MRAGPPTIPPELIDSPQRLIVHLLPADDRELLRKLAVPRYLDRELIAVLVDDEDGRQRAFDHHLLKKAAWDASGETRVIDDGIRSALLETFLDEEDGGDELSDLNTRLAAHLEDQGDGDSLEALYHRLGSDERRAGALTDLEQQVVELLRVEEGHEVDIARAHDLLRLLEERAAFDRDADALLARLRPRLVRRSRWARDREASRAYYEREFERHAWRLLRQPGKRWILQLHAPGGAGKTMFIRNLIGRICPAAEIPSARIDFDYVAHLLSATNQPWRLLLLIARQLDRQLVGRPFDSLLRRWGHLETRALPQVLSRRVLPTVAVDPGSDSDLETAAEEVPLKFRSILAHSRGEEPVVVVLDTLENLLETEGTALLRMIDELARVRDGEDGLPGVQGLRLVLSGRFDLAEERLESWHGESAQAVERVPGFRARYVGTERLEEAADGVELRLGEQVATLLLPPFSDPDALCYLKENCELPADERSAAIVDKANGNPMTLALLADAVEQDPELTAADIRAWKNADLFYLVDRVIDRILDPEVQWLVRWGVVPRLLTRDFVDRVLWPLFLEHQSGKILDRPAEEAEAEELPAPRTGQRRFRPVEPRPDAAAAWRRLTHYASTASWVRAVRELPDTLDFHPEVRDPMRGLLRRHDQQIYHELNRRALAYWRQLAGELEGAGRAAALRGVIFHAFEPWHGRPSAPERFFADLLEELGEQEELRAEVAREVLDVERRARREDRDDLEPPPPEIVARAHAEIVRYLARDLERDVAAIPQLRQHLDRARLRDGERALIDGRALLAEGRREQADVAWSRALEQEPLDGEIRALLRLELGVLRRDRPLLEQVLLETAGGQTLDEDLRRETMRQLAEFAFEREDYARSADLCTRLGDVAGRARSLIWLGRPGAAERLLGDCARSERRTLQALVDYAFYRALRLLEPQMAEDEAEGLTWQDMTLLRARALIMLGMEEEALSALESLMQGLEDVQAAVTATHAAARLSLRREQAEDARGYLAQLPDDLPADLAIQVRLLDVEALARLEAASRARRELDALDAEDSSGWLPSTRIGHALTRLILLGVDHAGLDRLIAVLRDITPASRRLYLLARLRFVGTPYQAPDADQVDELLALTEPDDDDGPRLLLARSDLLRICHRPEQARELLLPMLEVSEVHVAWRYARLALDRVGWPEDWLEQPDAPEAFPEAFRQRVRQEHAARRGEPPRNPERNALGPLLEREERSRGAFRGIDEDGERHLSLGVVGGSEAEGLPARPPRKPVDGGTRTGKVGSPDVESPAPEPWQRLDPNLAPESEWLRFGTSGNRVIDPGLPPRLVERWNEFSEELGRAVVDRLVRTSTGLGDEPSPAPAGTLLIPRTTSAPAWIPWQLGRVAGKPLASLPGFEAMVRSARVPSEAEAVPEPTALALVSSEQKYDRTGGRSEKELYYRFKGRGTRIERFTDLRRQALADHLGILYLVAPLEERRGGSLVLRLESEWGAALGARQLARMLDERKRLIILDVPWPGSPHEAAHQLLLRELFAQELSQRRPGVDLLLTGFSGADPQVPLSATLLDALGEGLSLAALAGRLQRLEPRDDSFASWLVAHGTSVYCADPQRRVRIGRHDESA